MASKSTICYQASLVKLDCLSNHHSPARYYRWARVAAQASTAGVSRTLSHPSGRQNDPDEYRRADARRKLVSAGYSDT